MENASKALLIAGAILLVIALIAIGMMVLGQGQNVVENTNQNMSGLSAQATNDQYMPYLDKDLSASEYNSLRAMTIANKMKYIEDGTSSSVLTGTGAATQSNLPDYSSIPSGKTAKFGAVKVDGEIKALYADLKN